jgi:predicted permease
LPWRASRAARDVDDELRFHLEMRIAELERGGMTPADARREALRQFGDVADASAYCTTQDRRRMRDYYRALLLDNVRHDFVVALRGMSRRPGFTAATVLTLAAAIGLATAVYGVVHAYIVRPLPYPEPDRLATVLAAPSRTSPIAPPSLANVDWRAVDSAFDATVAWDLDGFTLPGGERPEYVNGAWVSPGYFTALGMRPALGRGFLPDEFRTGAQVAIISDALWSRRFARDERVIGRTIRAHSTDRPRDTELVTIVGVMGADAWHVSRFTDVLRPLDTPRFPSIIRLGEDMSLAQAQARLNAIVLPQVARSDTAWHMSLIGLQDDYIFELRPTLMALLGASVLVLLIGGASVAGALVARAATRRGEIEVRMAIGATRARIVTQLLSESVLLAGGAAIAGTLVAQVLLSMAGTVVGEHLGAGVPGGASRLEPDALVLGAGVLLGVVVGLVFGLLPALFAARFEARGVTAGAEKGSVRLASSARLRRGLIAAQVALTTMLLAGAGLMTRSIRTLADLPLGFDAQHVLKANLLLPLGSYPDSASRLQGLARLLDGLARHPSVEAAAVVQPLPFRGELPTEPVSGGQRPEPGVNTPRAVSYVVGGDFFRTLGIPLVAGRLFDGRDATGATAVVSEQLARRLWPDADPLGRQLRAGDDSIPKLVVGVVRDTREVAAAEQVPEVYFPFTQHPRAYFSVLTRLTSDPRLEAQSIQRTVGRVDDVLALAEIETMEEVVSRDGQRRRALTALLTLFGAFALAVAAFGLYSSLAYVVTQRQREIAVRVAVGASRRGIAGLVLREGVSMLAMGLVAGTAMSVALTQFIESQLFGVRPTDPITFAAILGIIALATMAAVVAPIRRAWRVEPIAILRAE